MKKILILIMFVLNVVLFQGCDLTETSNLKGTWKTNNGFCYLYEYTGYGELNQMAWSGNAGIVVIMNTQKEEVFDYIDKYKNDNSFVDVSNTENSSSNIKYCFEKKQPFVTIEITTNKAGEAVIIKVTI